MVLLSTQHILNATFELFAMDLQIETFTFSDHRLKLQCPRVVRLKVNKNFQNEFCALRQDRFPQVNAVGVLCSNTCVKETALCTQGSYRQVGVKFRDFSRTFKSLVNSFQGLKIDEKY